MVKTASQEDPVGPRWIVVSTSTVATHLRLSLGWLSRNAVLTGTRIVPLPQLVSRLVQNQRPGSSQSWSPLLELLLLEVLNRVEPESPLAYLRDLPAASSRLRPTFLDLADAGFGPQQIELLQELAGEPDLSPLESETLRVYLSWLQTLKAAQLEWEPVSRQQIPDWIESVSSRELCACLGAEEGQQPHLFFYGFYDFTDVNLQLVVALSRRLPLILFFPLAQVEGKAHPAFSFAEASLQDLKLRLGPDLETVERLDPWSEPGSPEAFFLDSFPEGKATRQPDFLSFQKASGIRSEVLSAAVRIRRWLDDGGDSLQANEVLVVAPRIEVYLDTVEEIFPAFAIPFSAVDVPIDSSPDRRALQMLERLWQDQVPVEWLLSYLREFPSLSENRKIDLDHFEKILRSVPVWGEPGWRNLARIAGTEPYQETLGFNSAELALIQEIVEFWLEQTVRERYSVAQALQLIETLQQQWVEDSWLLEPLLKSLRGAQDLLPDGSIPRSMLLEMLRGSAETQMRSDRLDRNAVVLAPLMRARGLTARAVVLLGLASGQVPFRVEEDPLFSDASRRRLLRKAGEVGHRLPIKSLALEEMILLFYLLNTSADRIHWVVPETDEGGKSVAPTPWVQKFLQEWSSSSISQDLFQSRVPRSPAEQAAWLHRLEPQSGTFLPPEWLALLQPEAEDHDLNGVFPVELQGNYSRKKDPHWYGLVPSAAATAGGRLEKVTVTGLEDLARCPYRFYARNVAHFRILPCSEAGRDLDPLQWGSLLHAVLEAALRPFLGSGLTLSQIARRWLENGAVELKLALNNLKPHLLLLLELVPSPFSDALKARLLRKLHSYFSMLSEAERVSQPIDLERKFRSLLPGAEWLSISGVIDRIESDGRARHVVDYKSGRSPWASNRKQAKREVEAGFRMQPHLYPWLARDPTDFEVPGFSYVFMAHDPPRVEQVPTDPEQTALLLQPLIELLRKGYFFWTSNESLAETGETMLQPCTYCEFLSLCRRFEPGGGAVSLYHLRRLAPRRAGFLVREENSSEEEFSGRD